MSTDSIVPVADPNSWPENTDTSILVVVDGSHVEAVQVVPTSCSGDWYNTYTYVFSEAGRTVVFERHSAFFNGCPSRPSAETSIYFFEDGDLIRKDYDLVDRHDEPLATTDCRFLYRHEYEIYASWTDLASAWNLPLSPVRALERSNKR